MFHRLGLINKSQSGFTLVEMLVVVAILGFVGVAANTAVSQTVKWSTRGPEYMTAIKQVENAFHWINRDVRQAQTIEPGKDSGFPLSLAWVDWDGTAYQVIYTVENGELKRSHSVNGTASSELVVARYVNPETVMTNCWLTADGTFDLPDVDDAFTIAGGVTADSGRIFITTGSVSVATTGTASYDSGIWTAPTVGDNITVTATSTGTKGIWTSSNMTAVVVRTEDDDADAMVTGSVLVVTITAKGGDQSQLSETRVAKISPRSRL